MRVLRDEHQRWEHERAVQQLQYAAQGEERQQRVCVLTARGVCAEDIERRGQRVEEKRSPDVPHVHGLREQVAGQLLDAAPGERPGEQAIDVVQRRPAEHQRQETRTSAGNPGGRALTREHEIPAEYYEDRHAEARCGVEGHAPGHGDVRGVYHYDEKGGY